MILRVKPTPTPDQQSLYPGGQHTLTFYIKCVPSVGQALRCFLGAKRCHLELLRP